MAAPEDCEPSKAADESEVACSHRVSAADVYRRLVLLSIEFRDLALRHHTIEGRTALQVAGLVIRDLASAFFSTRQRSIIEGPDEPPSPGGDSNSNTG